jgi:ubiquinone/menaquinone biosynthesis C-methylase UbiE
MSTVKQKPAIPPMKITALLHAPRASQILNTAVELDIFSQLSSGLKGASAIARAIGTDSRGTGLLLDSLAGLEIIRKTEEGFCHTETSELYLVPSSPLYMGAYLQRNKELAKSWDALTDSVRSGKPNMQVDKDDQAQEFFPDLVRALFPINYSTAGMVVKALNIDSLPEGSRILDIAAGSGAWSIPMAEANPGVKLEALDFPVVLDVTREFVGKRNLSDRFSYHPGSWRDIELEDGAYDVIILGHILHAEGWKETEMLLKKSFKALKTGGMVVIAEFIAGENGPVFPLIFALHMFLVTTAGCVFSENELKDLLASSGFINPERLELPYYGQESPVVVATRES